MTERTMGNVLKELRKKKKLSAAKLSKEINISASYIYDIEYDKRVPSTSCLKTIAEYFGVSIDYLMGHADKATATMPSEEIHDIADVNSKKGLSVSPPRVGADSINPQSFDNVVLLPIVNYSELTEDLKNMDTGFYPVPASKLTDFDTKNLYLVQQDIPFRMAELGPIPAMYGVLANNDFSFKNGRIYIVLLKQSPKICRLTQYPDGSVDLSDDLGTQTLSKDNQESMGFKILAKIEAALPIELIMLG